MRHHYINVFYSILLVYCGFLSFLAIHKMNCESCLLFHKQTSCLASHDNVGISHQIHSFLLEWCFLAVFLYCKWMMLFCFVSDLYLHCSIVEMRYCVVGSWLMVFDLVDEPKLAIIANRERRVDHFVQGCFGCGSMHVICKVSARCR